MTYSHFLMLIIIIIIVYPVNHILLCRKTQVGSIEINDIRPPRFIGRDGVRYIHIVPARNLSINM